ncbi:NACHT domain-containing protein [Pseudonocardia charpentierae]|uniref:Pentapeptide repeat-containing protein n=1 Tax=Pseudonocardia charpentierae TaxID=3075545 RepID=A0ABU2NCM9_9PSEU|nr:pentapeptide repeat-containing protein [Pseudonocardia sp. DSM 45834]MDT0351705.1 pentapeptide repeat-containing protein [Pseudonocardia sp. DSM 45834]
MSLLETVVKTLISLAAKPAIDRLKRQEEVVALLKKFKLAPDMPPSNFEGVYTYALIEYCYGMPEPIINFFRNEYIQSAFRRSFETGDTTYLNREADEIFRWNDETGALGRLDYDFRRDLAGFTAMFDAVVDRTRSPATVRSERKIEQYGKSLHIVLSELKQQINETRAVSDVQRLTPDPPTGNAAALEALRKEVREWFKAIGYRFETYELSTELQFTWIINVPARRRYDRIIVRGVAGEATAEDVDELATLVRTKSADEGWLVVPRRISAAAASMVIGTGNRVACYTLDSLIDQDADFDPYLQWLESEVQRRGIDTRYVQVGCKKDEVDPAGVVRHQSTYLSGDGGLEHYVETWLADSTMEHLSVLGEFGTGKTWFCIHFAWTRAQQYRQAKKRGLPRPRLPLLVPLRDYAKAVSIESLFSEFFFRKHEVNLPGYSAFEYLNRTGRLLLIFDGFDEMADRVDRQARINNFWELARAVTDNAKVLLTCRTEHFPEAAESRDLLSARLRASTQNLTGEPPQFEVVDILPFDDVQVRELLKHLTDDTTIDTIMANSDLLDLMRRPVMSELVLDALPEISAGGAVDIARIYLYAVRRKITRDIHAERTFTSTRDKVYFLSELSWEMLSTASMSINYREFPERIRACFGDAVREERDLDHWHHDMMGQSLLIRNSQGDYSPAHKSLLEFFVAYKFAAELGVMNSDFIGLIACEDGSSADNGAGVQWSVLGKLPNSNKHGVDSVSEFAVEPMAALVSSIGSAQLSPAVLELLLPMIDTKVAETRLADIIRNTRGRTSEETGFVGGNCASILARIDARSLCGQDLSGTSLRGARLDLFGKGEVDMTATNLAGADLSDTDFENVIFTGADLSLAKLTNSRYFGLNSSGFDSVLVQPSTGAIYASTVGGSIVSWVSSSRIGVDDPRVVHTASGHLREFEMVGAKWLIASTQDGQFYFYDTVTGALIEKVVDADGVTGVDQSNIEGFAVSYRGDRTLEEIHIHDFAGRRLGNVETGNRWRLGYYSSRLGKTFFLDYAGVIHALELGDGDTRLLEMGRIDFTELVAHEDVPFGDPIEFLRVTYSGELLWAVTSTNKVVAYDLTGERVAVVLFPEDETDLALSVGPFTQIKNWVFADKSSGIGTLVTARKLVAFQISDGQYLWAADNVAKSTSMAVVDAGSRCVVVDAFGGIEVRSARDGSIERVVCVNERFRDAKLASVVGVPDIVLMRLGVAGAITL